MSFPLGTPVIDTMISFPTPDSSQYDFIRRQLKDSSKSFEFPAEYMFRSVPHDLPTDDPVSVTLHEMDRFNIEKGLVGCRGGAARLALRKFPDRFVASTSIGNPSDVMGSVRGLVEDYETYGVRAADVFPAGTFPQVAIDDAKMYPIYAKCVELGIPIFVCAGVPGPRLPFAPQKVELIDQVMFDFPDLVLVTRHGCEPWTDLAVKLLLKWPNLYYSTSAFAPRYYPREIVEFANTRGADKVIYGGYFPMGLTLDRIMKDMQDVPFRDHVWSRFLHENARRVLRLDE
ncbi:amidohydrolase family protein [Frankia sp. Mgl5]|uniref:amidohydrolase family protein n=1 Tax=Frankia sp. Mgl5 TaxID=2933793 RepID=UPI00200C610C|nr:amidohydrolase family protein [Frankia sp. Mgl5]MCK9926308.1 amidohydrolase family protein [Frankia sp. Mgl5]